MNLPVITTRDVPCGTCRECCIGDAIYMHPECGDDASQYLTEEYQGRTILQHKENGECIYLDRETGCTIHDRRPVVCRELDCRALVRKLGDKQMKRMGLGKILSAAKRVFNNGIGTMPGGAA